MQVMALWLLGGADFRRLQLNGKLGGNVRSRKAEGEGGGSERNARLGEDRRQTFVEIWGA